MEYKINEFNITDIKYTDLKGLINCFENSIPLSKISLCNFGPNLLHVKSSEEKLPKTKEDKKILKEQANLILSSLNSKEKNEENNFCFSMSNNINKIYLKRFLSQININLRKGKNKGNNNDGKQDVYEMMNFFELISFFTCIKDEYGDEIPLTDYSLSVSVDKSVKYNKINLAQFNYEYIFHNIINKTNDQACMNRKNNIHFFYMLLYNLPINDIASYIYCEETKDYFSIFSEEESLDELAKRFFFINQFKMLKNDESYKLMAIDENNNVENIRYNINAIKTEYDFYLNLYELYLKIKKELVISDDDEKNIFGIYFAILLLSEFDFKHDSLFNSVIKKTSKELNQNEGNKQLTNIYNYLRNILLSDNRFNLLGSNKKGGEKKKILNLLNKLSICLGIPEDKLFYILLTENSNNKENMNKEIIVSNEFSLFKNIVYFMNLLYLKSIHNIIDIFSTYHKKQKLTISGNKPKKIIHIHLMRSNLVYNITYENYLCSKNSYLSIGDNFIDSNSFIIKQNIKEHLYANYIQEKKNYIYLKNSLSLNFNPNFPKISENEEYLSSIFKDSINFEEILNVYENDICGLLQLINYGENNTNNTNVHKYNIYDSKGGFNLNHFKAQFNKNISRKNKIEFIEVFNSIEEKNETYIKVSHSFGVFLYDLNQLFGLDNSNNQNIYNITPNIYKEQAIFKLLEYKPNLNNFTSFKFYQTKTNKIISSLITTKKPLFISCLMELNKFNTLTLFDDMKINIIYVYYSNYCNYLLDINGLKQHMIQYNSDFIPKMIRNKDNLTFFKFLTKKFRITLNDYMIDNYNEKKEGFVNNSKFRNKESRNACANYVFIKNKLSNSFGKDKNISLMMYKYNYPKFIQIFCDKISKSKFNYFIYAINGIKAFVKLTKIYKEKLVLSNVRNLMTDIIVDNYDIISESDKDNSITPINQQMIPKIDNLDELVFDFNKEALGKMLPKLRSNLVQLKRMWKDYLNDIIYLINNNSIFYNKECAQLIIEQRMINFLIILFLFHKNYKFINSESLRKFGVLLSKFINTVSKEVLKLFLELRNEFDLFLSENDGINDNLNELKSNFENINFQTLIIKRIEIQNIINQKIKEKEKNFEKINQQKMREKNLENNNLTLNGGEEIAILGKNNKFVFEENLENEPTRNKYKEFSISKKDLYEGRLDNNFRTSKNRKPSSRVIESFNTVNRNSNTNSNNNILQLTHGNSSVNDTPNTEINRNPSSDLDSNNNNYVNGHKYKFKYSNIALKKVEDVSKVIKTKSNKNNNENNSDSGRNSLADSNINIKSNNSNINNNKDNQNEIKNNNIKVNNNSDVNNINPNSDEIKDINEKNAKLRANNNKSNSEQLSKIDKDGNMEGNYIKGKENDNNINPNENNALNNNNKKDESDQFYHSPSFSKNDFRKEEDKNSFVFNKTNDYSFKNSINSSANNFNQNLANVNNNSIANNKSTKNSNRQSNSKMNIEKKKGSKNNSNVMSHKKLNNINEENGKNNSIKKNNNNYISFKDNNSDDNNDEYININNYSLFSDNELQKIYQTLSDINEVNIEKNEPKNYMTYPFEKNNDILNIIKEVPIKVKKRLSSYCVKIVKEKKIKKVSDIDNMIPSLKELNNKINQIRKEINLIDVNEYYNVKIEKLHFNELEEDKETDDKLYKMADELNLEFYNDIVEKLNIAQEKINELTL